MELSGIARPPAQPGETFHGHQKHIAFADLLQDIIPVIMAGIIAIYGLVVSVLISNDLSQNQSCSLASFSSVLVSPSVLLVLPPVSPLVLLVTLVSVVLPSSPDSSSE